MGLTVFNRFCTIYDSSNIKKVSYDTQGHRLGVVFLQKDGTEKHYIYEDVPLEIFGSIVSAESVGKEFQRHKLKGTAQ